MELPIYFSMGISIAKQGESLEEHLKNADNLMDEEKIIKKPGNKNLIIQKGSGA